MPLFETSFPLLVLLVTQADGMVWPPIVERTSENDVRPPPALEAVLSGPLFDGVSDLRTRFDSAGRMRYVVGSGLAPDCSTVSPARAPSNRELEEVARCAIRTYAGLLGLEGEEQSLRLQRLRVVRFSEGAALVRLRQHMPDDGVAVLGRSATAVIEHGRLFSLRARLETPSLLDAAPPPPTDLEWEAAEASLGPGRKGAVVGRFYDAERGRFVTEVEDLLANEAVTVDVETHDSLGTRSLVHHAPLTRNLNVVNFGNGWNVSSSNPALQQRPATFNAAPSGSLYCAVKLDRWGGTSVAEPLTTNIGITYPQSPTSENYISPGSCSQVSSLVYNWPITQSPLPANKNGIRASLYFWVHDLAVFAKSAEALLHAFAPFENLQTLQVGVGTSAEFGFPCAYADGCFFAGSDAPRLLYPYDERPAFDLGFTAHEFGHYINWAYNYLPNTTLDEGLANSHQLRYGLYRNQLKASRPHDSVYSAVYGTFSYPSIFFRNLDHRVSDRNLHGQRLPTYYYQDSAYDFETQAVLDAVTGRAIASKPA